MITKANLKCPKCGYLQEVEMPTNSCIYFYTCAHCGEILKPKAGDCCVFCSYADVTCPPVQIQILKDMGS